MVSSGTVVQVLDFLKKS